MFKTIKSIKVLTRILLLILIIFSIIFSLEPAIDKPALIELTLPVINFRKLFSAYFVGILVIILLTTFMTNRLLRKTFQSFIRNKNPKKCIDVIGDFFYKNRNKPRMSSALISYACILFGDGQYAESKELLESIKIGDDNKKYIDAKFYRSYMLFLVAIELNEIDEAKTQVEFMENVILNYSTDIDIYDKLKAKYEGLSRYMYVIDGDYEKSLLGLTEDNLSVDSDTQSVEKEFIKGRIYYYLGEKTKARNCLENVITYGNELYRVAESEVLLKTLGN